MKLLVESIGKRYCRSQQKGKGGGCSWEFMGFTRPGKQRSIYKTNWKITMFFMGKCTNEMAHLAMHLLHDFHIWTIFKMSQSAAVYQSLYGSQWLMATFSCTPPPSTWLPRLLKTSSNLNSKTIQIQSTSAKNERKVCQSQLDSALKSNESAKTPILDGNLT